MRHQQCRLRTADQRRNGSVGDRYGLKPDSARGFRHFDHLGRIGRTTGRDQHIALRQKRKPFGDAQAMGCVLATKVRRMNATHGRRPVRAAEEARWLVRWLRPAYQTPAGFAATKGEQTKLDVGRFAATAPPMGRLPARTDRRRPRPHRIGPTLLESLSALGQTRMIEDGRFAA